MPPTRRIPVGWRVSYEPDEECIQLGIRVRTLWLRDTWGAWAPQHRTIVLAEGLTPVQRRCVLAHEVEHAIADHATGCGSGPYAELSEVRRQFSLVTIRQERHADLQAARKLIAISDLAELAQWFDGEVTAVAAELGVTERMLTIRLRDLQGEGWPWRLVKSKIAG